MISKFKNLFASKPAAAPTGPVEYIVAGLGNPGREYEATRHNTGFLAIDYIAEKCGAQIKKLKFKALTGDAVIAGKRVLLLKPSTYMNLSGQSVTEAMAFYKVPVENLIVISDDTALPIGKMRIRRSGSDGGQKGLGNIIYLLGKDTFPRIRIGVGTKPHPEMSLADWVLSRFTEKDFKALAPMWDNAYQAVGLIVQGKIDEAMNRFN